jgi:hypothetical protein
MFLCRAYLLTRSWDELFQIFFFFYFNFISRTLLSCHVCVIVLPSGIFICTYLPNKIYSWFGYLNFASNVRSLKKFILTWFLTCAYVAIIYEDGGDWGLGTSRLFLRQVPLFLLQTHASNASFSYFKQQCVTLPFLLCIIWKE